MANSEHPIVYIDRSEILPGELDAVQGAIAALVALADEREPQLLAHFVLPRQRP